MAKRAFVGKGEKDPPLVGGDEGEPQPRGSVPHSRHHTTSLGQVLCLRCDVSLARGAWSHTLRRRDDTHLAWTQAGPGASTGQTVRTSALPSPKAWLQRPGLLFPWVSPPALTWGQLVKSKRVFPCSTPSLALGQIG